jgi:integrase
MRVSTLKKKASSLETDVHRLKVLKKYFHKVDVISITEKQIVDFQAYRLRAKLSPSTVNSDVRTLMKILQWALRQKLLPEIPRVEQIPEYPKEVELPTQEEIRLLLEALSKSALPVVWFIAETGCRSGEAFNLTWDCVDEVKGWVEFKSKDGWTPKTFQSQRRVPIGTDLVEMFRSMPKEGIYVFPTKSDFNKPRDNVRKALAGAIRRAGINRNGVPMKITPRVLRKAFARGIYPNTLEPH